MGVKRNDVMRCVVMILQRGILLWLMVLLGTILHFTPAIAQPCLPSGDVNQDGSITPADALRAFQHFLNLTELDACQRVGANVVEPENDAITPDDALCILRAFLGLPSCLDASGRPARLEAVTSHDVHVVVNAPLRLAARVTASMGEPVASVPVTFQRTAGSGILTAAQVSTDASGEAATSLTIETTAETTCVEARVAGPPPVVFAITGVAERDIRLSEVSGNNQVAAPGQEVAAPFVVRVETQFGNPLAGAVCAEQSGVAMSAAARAVPGDSSEAHTPLQEQDGIPVAGVRVTAAIIQGQAVFVADQDEVLTEAQGVAAFGIQAGESNRDIVTRVTALEQTVDFVTAVGLVDPVEIAVVKATSDLVVADTGLDAIVRIIPDTGALSLISGRGKGSGLALQRIEDVAVEADGNLVVVERIVNAVTRVNSITGDRTVISGCTQKEAFSGCSGTLIGSGPALFLPVALAVEADGNLVVVDFQALVRVNPLTGSRTVISGCSEVSGPPLDCNGALIGNGPAFFLPRAIAVEASGQLVVVDDRRDDGANAVIRVDPITGDRSIISSCADFDDFECLGGSIGSGPPPGVNSIAVEANGNLVTLDFDTVVRVNPVTGNRTIVIEDDADFVVFSDITVETDGNFVIVDAQTVVRVEPNTRDRTVVARGGRGSGPSFLGVTDIAMESDGNLVVVDDIGAIVRIEPFTGNRTLVSGASGDGSSADRGSGLSLDGAADIAVEADGGLVVATNPLFSTTGGGVVRVNRATGDRALVSGSDGVIVIGFGFDHSQLNNDPDVRGSGPAFLAPKGITTIEANGQLIVADADLKALLRVDPTTGDRTLVSGCSDFEASPFPGMCIGTIMGSGPAFRSPEDVAIEADGQFVVVDPELKALLRVDPTTGDRTLVSGCSDFEASPFPGMCIGTMMGSGPAFRSPTSIAVETDGALVVVDRGLRTVLRVDAATGNRTVLSGCTEIVNDNQCSGDLVGNGLLFTGPTGIAIETSGSFVVVDRDLEAVLRVSPFTGDRTLLAK